MRTVPASVAWISVAPVKGLRLEQRDDVLVTDDGVPGDRAFFVADGAERDDGERHPPGALVAVMPTYDEAGRHARAPVPGRRPGGRSGGAGEPESVDFGGPARARAAGRGPLLRGAERALQPAAAPRSRRRPAARRGPGPAGAVTLLSDRVAGAAARQAGERGPIDPRRFRMTFGVAGLEPHEEDGWLGRGGAGRRRARARDRQRRPLRPDHPQRRHRGRWTSRRSITWPRTAAAWRRRRSFRSASTRRWSHPGGCGWATRYPPRAR